MENKDSTPERLADEQELIQIGWTSKYLIEERNTHREIAVSSLPCKGRGQSGRIIPVYIKKEDYDG